MELPDQTDKNKVENFKFSGDASEYFGIYMVNNIFTWLTLGIYSAWAKVRTLQYFYGNTELAGGRFQFTASPLRILRGRVIAFLLFILYLFAENIESTIANIVLFTFIGGFILLSPVLTVLVMSFKLRYSEWRGISFSFKQNFREAYRVYLIPTSIVALFFLSFLAPFNSTQIEEFFGYDSPAYNDEVYSEDDDSEYISEDDEYASEDDLEQEDVVDDSALEFSSEERLDNDEFVEESDDYSYESDYSDSEYEDDEDSYTNPYFFIPSALLGLLILLLMPYFDFINLRFLARNIRLGNANFNYTASARDYYIVYGKWLAAVSILIVLWLIEAFYHVLSNVGVLWLLTIVTVIAIPATRSYFKSQRYNLLLNKTSIDNKHQLNANTRFLSLFWLMLSNSIVIVFTLGLMKPWAQIRTARYLLEHSSLSVKGSLDDFIASQDPDQNAMVEEVADMFDLDILG